MTRSRRAATRLTAARSRPPCTGSPPPDAVPAEIRLYSHLFNRPDPGADGDALADLNPQSLEVLTGALVEPALLDTPIGEAVQFERTGYFALDPDSKPGTAGVQPTVGLRDTVGEGAGQGVAAPPARIEAPTPRPTARKDGGRPPVGNG